MKQRQTGPPRADPPTPRPAVLPNVCIAGVPAKTAVLEECSRVGVHEGHFTRNSEAPWDSKASTSPCSGLEAQGEEPVPETERNWQEERGTGQKNSQAGHAVMPGPSEQGGVGAGAQIGTRHCPLPSPQLPTGQTQGIVSLSSMASWCPCSKI